MRKAWLIPGMLAALLGAVFISLGIWEFLVDRGKNIFSPSVWTWFGLHAAAALLSLVFFRLASPGVDKPGTKRDG
jgi:hypothetical protein